MFAFESRTFYFVLAGLLFLGLGTAERAEAPPFDTLSVGLNEGDQFRLAVVTSQTRDAIPIEVDPYNDFVLSQADAGDLTGDLGIGLDSNRFDNLVKRARQHRHQPELGDGRTDLYRPRQPDRLR